MRQTVLIPVIAAAAVAAFAGQAQAAEHQVKMLNNGPQGMMAFEPAALKIKPGDTVRIVPTDPGHNVETIQGMLPPGATIVKGPMSKETVVAFPKAGTYGFKCAPHFGMGMVFVVKVGDGAPNLADAQTVAGKAPPLARKRFADDFTRLK